MIRTPHHPNTTTPWGAPAPTMAPHNVGYEQCVLAGLLVAPHLMDLAQEREVCRDDFYVPEHKLLWDLFEEWYTLGEFQGEIALEWLQKLVQKVGTDGADRYGGLVNLVSLIDNACEAPLMGHYLTQIRELRIRRASIRLLMEKAEALKAGRLTADEVLAEVRDSADDVLEKTGAKVTRGLRPMPELIERLIDIACTPNTVRPVRTGIDALDAKVEFMPSDLVVIAARPSHGKTALLMNIVEHQVQNSAAALIFSLEMPAHQLTARMFCPLADVDRKRTIRGELTPEEVERLQRTTWAARKWRMEVDDTPGLSAEDIAVRSRAWARKHGAPAVIAVDYLQHLSFPPGSRNEAVGAAAVRMKDLAKELGTTVLLLSQLNREIEKRMEKRPTMSDLRDSGAIEQEADVILFLYREEVYNKTDPSLRGKAQAIIAKYRNGEAADVELRFDGPRTRFHDADPYPDRL